MQNFYAILMPRPAIFFTHSPFFFYSIYSLQALLQVISLSHLQKFLRKNDINGF